MHTGMPIGIWHWLQEILRVPGAVSRDYRMFVVKVYSKIDSELSPRTFYRPN